MTGRTLGVSAALVDGRLLPGDIRIDGGVVTDVGLPPAAGGRIAAPGLVDIQVNDVCKGAYFMQMDRTTMTCYITLIIWRRFIW